jgi:hypothetical protein
MGYKAILLLYQKLNLVFSLFLNSDQLSCFLSAAGGYEVVKSGELCQGIIFVTMFLICTMKKKESYRSSMFQALPPINSH